ncbi:MAG: leucyl aminopeptidase [Alphaproteobacteria bacterium]|nr:leucyl aminopeptidase [Alphaproteobacteria bacterium]
MGVIRMEFTIGRNIAVKTDKFFAAPKSAEILKLLNSEEQTLRTAIKRQTKEDNIVEYNLGEYRVFAAVTDQKTPVEWQKFGAKLWNKAQKCPMLKIALPKAKEQDIYNFSLGIELAAYRFDKYFTKKTLSFYPKLEKIIYTNTGLKNMDGYKPTAGLASAVRYARDLISEPANELTPEIMAADIKRLEYLGLEVKILEEAEMKARGFNLALAVAQGSINRPRIAIIKWRGNPAQEGFSFGLVGKGVTFDSGGISIKPAANMGDMKQDMAGAAVMVATMKSLALQKLECNVVAVVGLVENMPSGAAYRPGDVIKSMSGQTVEIVNTDAEGRLVLADCLTYIQQEFKPEYVFDMATLTGAIIVALGHTFAGVFSNDAALTRQLSVAGEKCGERVWNMPMDAEFDKLIDSAIADMKNCGPRVAGSATAACFLKRFIAKGTKWAHIDIAGMDLSEGTNPLYPKGASGYGVRLLNMLLTQIV